MAERYVVEPDTIKHWHSGEWFIKTNNPSSIVAHGWTPHTARSCLMGEAKLDRKRMTIADCLFRAKVGGKETKWLIRDYNWNEATVERCEFHDADTEHAIYVESWGNVLLRDLYIHEMPAQAYQDAWRASEVIDPEARLAAGTVTIERVRLENVGQPRGGGRYGFAFSFFEAQGCPDPKRNQSVIGDDITMLHRDGSSMCVIKHRPRLELLNLHCEYRSCNTLVWDSANSTWKKKKREAWLIEHVPAVILKGHIQGGDIKIKNAKRVRLETTGNGVDMIWLDGKKMGPISKGLVWSA